MRAISEMVIMSIGKMRLLGQSSGSRTTIDHNCHCDNCSGIRLGALTALLGEDLHDVNYVDETDDFARYLQRKKSQGFKSWLYGG